jgi:hypothetical protein
MSRSSCVAYAIPAMDGDSTRGRRAALPGVAIALAFLAVGLVTLPDRGLTWDEPESLLAGVGNLEILRTVASGSTDFEWPWHELRGHQFVIDTLRVLVARAVAPLVGGPGGPEVPGIPGVPIRGAHLFHLLLASVSLLLVHLLATRLSGSVRVGALAALLLATLPKWVAHSQNNPKDLVALFFYTLFLWSLERSLAGAESPATRLHRTRFLLSGAILGLAFTSHVLSALLVPIGGAWLLYRLRRRRTRWRDLLRAAAVLGAISGVTTFALWPWLWADPMVRTVRALRRVVTFPLDMEVLHLGRLYPATELPPEYFVVHLAVATPLFVLAAAAWGAVAGLHLRGGRPGRRPLAVLALLWLLVPVTVEAFTSARYDGVRHLLCVLPALAILAAMGIDDLWRRVTASDRRPVRAPIRAVTAAALALLTIGAASWLWTLVDLARYHPYQDAYLNAATRRALALADRRPEEVFELEYWGAAYEEGAGWLAGRAAERGERLRVWVPFAAWCAAPYAGPRVTVMGEAWLDGRAGGLGVLDTGGTSPDSPVAPDALMWIPRRSFGSPGIEAVRRRLEPVHTVERLGATLLEIYDLSR